MTKIKLSTDPRDFIWASGIEDTFVPQTRMGHRALDEYELMGHYEHWREDLLLLKEVGVQAVRWGIPWYRIEPTPGNFDWRWIDEVLPFLVEELGITPIIDLMHYGCPFWLRREFASDEYPLAVAAYAEAFAKRYSSLVSWYTPLNEPLVNALMCGRRGIWPPYLKGDSGYIRVMLQIVRGVLNTVEALKTVDPNSVMVQVEATGLSRAIKHELEVLALEDQRRGYLFFDLISGLVTHDHPLTGWLLRNGATPDDLAGFRSRRIPIDVMGMNFYPQWSTQQIYIDGKGRISYRAVEQDGAGFATLIADYYQRYQVPIMITETSALGDSDVRARWMHTSIEAVKQLRASGVPVVGYTWFPLFTMVDWRYRLGRRPIERYYIELGLYRLNREADTPRWIPTPLLEQMQNHIAQTEESVGPFIKEEQHSFIQQ
ncbi:MAG TPA: family 1 glycosylhydrolase [Blastocatellia bacterium]|nr:family 1 glycosylhydrolase [Blastocatellia bacterium]